MRRFKLFFILPVITLCFVMTAEAQDRRGFAVGMGPVGNVYVIDTVPVMDPGIGGYTFFQYRFLEQLAFQAGFMITTQGGSSVSANDDSILFLGMPTIDLKYYFLTGDSAFDPFISLGTGFYILTEGDVSNNSGGVGIGANLGVGVDYYVTQTISVGFEGVFRSIGIISDLGTPSNSTAIFPYSLMANVAFHF